MQHLTRVVPLVALFALSALLTLGGTAQAGVMSTLTFNADASAGDEASDSAAYSINTISDTADETAAASDGTGSVRGTASAQGIADFSATELSFGQNSFGVGGHSASATTVLTQQITNDGAAGTTGTFRSEILAGGLALAGIGTGTAIADFDASASFAVDISLDGTSLFAFSGAIASDGTSSLVNTGFLNGLTSSAMSSAASVAWDDTLLDLDLGLFDAAETKELVLTMTTSSSNSTDCVELAGPCIAAGAAIGDPPDGGFGSVMLFSLYFEPTEVLEPDTTILLGLGLLGLFAQRRFRNNRSA